MLIICFSILEHQGHIIEIMKTFDISTINGIVAVGGDGTLNEVIIIYCY